jgi:hypothetical protein
MAQLLSHYVNLRVASFTKTAMLPTTPEKTQIIDKKKTSTKIMDYLEVDLVVPVPPSK